MFEWFQMSLVLDESVIEEIGRAYNALNVVVIIIIIIIMFENILYNYSI